MPGDAGGGAGHARRRPARLVLAGGHAREAKLIDGIEVAVVERLTSAARVLAGGPGDTARARRRCTGERACARARPDRT